MLPVRLFKLFTGLGRKFTLLVGGGLRLRPLLGVVGAYEGVAAPGAFLKPFFDLSHQAVSFFSTAVEVRILRLFICFSLSRILFILSKLAIIRSSWVLFSRIGSCGYFQLMIGRSTSSQIS